MDTTRTHEFGLAIAWHGRAMVFAWGILAPLAVIVARYFKILPGQDWPQKLDNQLWWHSHRMAHTCVLGLSILGLVLVLPLQISELSLHGALGCGVLVALVLQVALGVFRGSKGGPTASAPDGSLRGDHYDMTPRRRWFETLHKAIGYSVLVLAGVTILYGLVLANGPNWMSILIVLWWFLLGLGCIFFQRKGMATPSYLAIWGPDQIHPGNTEETGKPKTGTL